MCGNGIRCFAKYIYERGYVPKTEFSAETLAGVKNLKLTLFNDVVEQVRVDMGAPQVKRGEAQVSGNPEDSFIDQDVAVDGTAYKVTSVGMGNPHAVLFVGDVETLDVGKLGRKIRNLKKLFPHGVNVHFVKEEGKNEFRIRTYERGVEAETLACGTGICASAVAAVLSGKADSKKAVSFHAVGGDLSVEFEVEGKEIKAVYLVGPAVEVFRGELDYNP
jgi:diaminopimelate epimerase